eukprot:CAMPEP_0113667704 /NCGR_PEP_ID=MMETSP0038_2-20120614/3586_1 /TAXON_ID=2898 /ORGANISM="Cryptomonas paramecium" /LENGTH=103 /DNA_ID=CAMNT_0000583353 /DNA_START=72 /DNA_END=383 /DNA_ORIENTATION=- /assembly_acc=CAM_ASM_000170
MAPYLKAGTSEPQGAISDQDCDKMGLPRGSFWGSQPVDSWYPFRHGPPGQIGDPVNAEYLEMLTLPDGTKIPSGAVWANPARRVNGAEFQSWLKASNSVSGGY